MGKVKLQILFFFLYNKTYTPRKWNLLNLINYYKLIVFRN